MENNENNTNEEYITITVGNTENSKEKAPKRRKKAKDGKRTARIEKKDKKTKKGNKKERKKWSKKKKAIVISSIVLAIFLILGIVFGTYIYKADGNITEAVLNVATDVLGNDDPIFVLVLGVSEDIKTPLTDTIILCGYNPETQKAFMLSIPRDTFVGDNPNWASGYDKINAAYQKDVNHTVAGVEKLTGIEIDHWVVVRNTVLPDIVDAIGEVEFDVPIDMDYDDKTQNLHIHLDAGVQMIDGEEAEQLLRFRHNNDGSSYPSSYGDNDYGRMRTQREFIKAIANQLTQVGSTSNLKAIAEAVFHNLQTDMPFTKIAGYLPYGLKFNVENIRMEQLPGSSAMINDLWFYKSSASETKELMNELLTELGLDEKEMKKSYNESKIVKINTPASSSSKTENTNTTTSTSSTETTTQTQDSDKNTQKTQNNETTSSTNKNTNTSSDKTNTVKPSDDKVNSGNKDTSSSDKNSSSGNDNNSNNSGSSSNSGSTSGSNNSGNSGATGGNSGTGTGSNSGSDSSTGTNNSGSSGDSSLSTGGTDSGNSGGTSSTGGTGETTTPTPTPTPTPEQTTPAPETTTNPETTTAE